MPTVKDFAFDAANIGKLDLHRLSRWQVVEALASVHVVIRNRKLGTAPFLLIGRDRGGRCIALPIEPTSDPTLWRPVTGWYCKQSEEDILRRREGRRP